jgi:hypothetical protein
MHTIQTATLKEVELAVEWAAREGWNPGPFTPRILRDFLWENFEGNP